MMNSASLFGRRSLPVAPLPIQVVPVMELPVVDDLVDYVLANPFAMFMCREDSRAKILRTLHAKKSVAILRLLKEGGFVKEDLLAHNWESPKLRDVLKARVAVTQIWVNALIWSATRCAIRAAGVKVAEGASPFLTEADVPAAKEAVDEGLRAMYAGPRLSRYPPFYKAILENAQISIPIRAEYGPLASHRNEYTASNSFL